MLIELGLLFNLEDGLEKAVLLEHRVSYQYDSVLQEMVLKRPLVSDIVEALLIYSLGFPGARAFSQWSRLLGR